ncbi:hypothetical protein [Pseudoteredinibacter isoporae]|uniref:Uncharacterized protein n=1 Tax=Pseudoteredinibacter isoporae TaxID=570281 RepID=A0A7X0MWK5_9GAMM|nr:hypothetical protein [Pseudoteredinibacter isoporae]MBB6519932.1 hypothetical protein [Pseudoteredinibacter isoporae]NHO85508.1 hypothetical protein [Pseudoteredinibacter isoporae]NIB26040.1 hypothetical protein [Pseudoteredinibacter isoporae]
MDLVFHASLPALWAALASPQGIIASCLFCLGVLGFLLLQDMGENLRVSLLSLALFGLIALCYAYIQYSQPAVPLMVQQTKAPKNTHVSAQAPGIITRGDDDLSLKESGYIYIGRYRDKHWQNALFNDPTGPLSTGDVLQLNSARQMFACAPYRKEMLDLKFTYCKEVIGEAEANDNVRVARPPIIVGLSNVWVYVTKVES